MVSADSGDTPVSCLGHNHHHYSYMFALLFKGSGQIEFEEFVTLASKFIVEEDAESLQKELKEAFRLYDKEGKGPCFSLCVRAIFYPTGHDDGGESVCVCAKYKSRSLNHTLLNMILPCLAQ